METGFMQAGLLVLREGFEALLVIAALGAYLVKSGEHKRLPALYGGALAAVVASIALAWAFSRFNNGANNPLMEGIVLSAASFLLFYVSGWLLVRQDPRQWQSYLKKQADVATATGTMWAFVALSFFAVLREGAETVLFLSALAGNSGGWSGTVVAGAGAALVVLAGLFVLIEKLSVKLPLRAVFLVTSAFLFLMGLDFLGGAVKEFQEVGLLPATDSPLVAWLGADDELNLSWQAVGAQLAVVVLAAVGFAMMQRRKA